MIKNRKEEKRKGMGISEKQGKTAGKITADAAAMYADASHWRRG